MALAEHLLELLAQVERIQIVQKVQPATIQFSIAITLQAAAVVVADIRTVSALVRAEALDTPARSRAEPDLGIQIFILQRMDVMVETVQALAVAVVAVQLPQVTTLQMQVPVLVAKDLLLQLMEHHECMAAAEAEAHTQAMLKAMSMLAVED